MGILSKMKSAVLTSTAGKIATTAAVVVVLIGGVVGITYPAAFSSAESIVVRAAIATFAGQTSAGEEIFGIEELSASLKSRGAEISAQTSVKELSLEALGLGDRKLSNVGLQIVAKVTPQKEVSAVADMKVANITLLTGNAYLDQDRLQVNVPKLFQTVLTLNYNDANIEQKIKNSYAAEHFGLTDSQIETFVDYLPKQMDLVSKEEMQKKLLEIFLNVYDSTMADVEMQKAGTEELHKKDEVQNCKVYTAEISARQVGNFLNLSLIQLKEYAKEIYTGYNVSEQQLQEAFDNAFTWVYKIKANLRDTVVVKFYVWEERIVKISADWTMEVAKEGGPATEAGTLVIDFAPEGNPTENMYLAIHTPIHQETATKNVPQRVDLICQIKTGHTENAYTVNYQTKYNNIPREFSFAYEIFSGDFTVKVVNDRKSFLLTGVIKELVKGKKISLELDTFRSMEGNYVEEKVLDATVSLQPMNGKVTELSGERKDILAMTKKDFNSLEKEISVNITKLLFSMMGLFQ